jgi:ubiquinone biosynthesis protein
MPRPLTPGTAINRIRRFQHVVAVFARYGFGEALTRIRVWECDNIERRLFHKECRDHKHSEYALPQRLRMALEELGPTFIKLGQVMSTRPDLVPPDIIAELKKLQMSVHFISTEVVRGVIESELNKPISEVFDTFEDEPLAAASLAQVHKATLRGEKVVLKVQRPDIVNITETDLDILRRLAEAAQNYSTTISRINPVGLVNEFAEQLRKELDFRKEALNMHRFAKNFVRDRTIKVPRPFPKYCTRRVLAMEYLDGINISEVDRLKTEGYDLQLIAKRGAILGYKAAFDHGFFHADPHPGNIFVLPGNIIGLVDFGMMAILSQRDRERMAKLVYFISTRDEQRVARALDEIMESEEVISAESLEPAMAAIIGEQTDVSTDNMLLAQMLFGMMQAIVSFGGSIRPQLLWVTKSIAIQEDIAHSLGADFNVMQLGQPYARKVLTNKFNPLKKPEELLYWLVDVADLVREIPYNVRIILREFRSGKLKIEFEHIGLEPVRQTLERITNRMSLTVIIASLLVSSSVITLAEVPPFVGSIPLLAFLGYVLSFILSLFLLFSIWFRHR